MYYTIPIIMVCYLFQQETLNLLSKNFHTCSMYFHITFIARRFLPRNSYKIFQNRQQVYQVRFPTPKDYYACISPDDEGKLYLLYQLNIIGPPVLVPNKSCQVYPTKGGIICTNKSFKILSDHFIIPLK